MTNNRRCTNCGRFPFCLYQGVCSSYVEENMPDGDYWIKREVNKNEYGSDTK